MITPPSSSPADHTPWHILGAGAVGGLWALRLAQKGLPVTLIAHDDMAATRTLTVHAGDQSFSHTFPQVQPDHAGHIQRLLVTTKANVTAVALQPLLSQLAPGTPVLLLQNGMGTDEALKAQHPDLVVLTGITTDGVWRRDRDEIMHVGKGGTVIGAQHTAHQEMARQLAHTLSHELWFVEFAADIRERRWLKLAMNCAINPLTARYRCHNGKLLQNLEAMEAMRAICAEVAILMRAEGLTANGEDLFQLTRGVITSTASNLSSMCADVEAGRETEILFLNGYLLQKAAQHGIALPVNAALVREILLIPRR